jgi:hypothetical protein
MGENNAGQQIQNTVDQFQYLAQSGADVRDSLDPLIASMNEFQQLHPGQDIGPWVELLNQIGLLNGFTVSVNDDGSLAVVTSELEHACQLVRELRGQDGQGDGNGISIPTGRQRSELRGLLETDEGKEALIEVGFKVDENTTVHDLIAQIVDPNHPLEIPAKVKLTDDGTTD